MYDGDWKNGDCHGFGTLQSQNQGFLYRGSFRGNKRKKGVQVWTEFRIQSYRGDWKDDKPHGLGILVSTEGDKYVGGIEAGDPNGLGALKTKVKEAYGEFSCWEEHGFCTTIDLERDSQYKGQFHRGDYHGLGERIKDLKHPDLTFEGHFEKGVREGFGIQKRKGNKGFVGIYANDDEKEGWSLDHNRKYPYVKKVGEEFDDQDYNA